MKGSLTIRYPGSWKAGYEMKIIRCWSAFCLILCLGLYHEAHADTEIDGSATTTSSFTMTGPVFISSLTVNNTLAVSTITVVSSATITNLTVNGSITFSPTTTGINGTTTNDSAQTGKVGEYISATASAVNAPASATWGDLASISLTAGDWDVSAATTGILGLLPGLTCYGDIPKFGKFSYRFNLRG